MDLTFYGYFLCVVLPLAFLLTLLDQRSRTLILFVMIGAIQFLFSQNVTEVMLSTFSRLSPEYIMTTYTPLVFEASKAIPIVFYAFVFEDDRSTLLSLSTATGTGFAIMESLHMFLDNTEDNVLSVCCLTLIYILINIVCTGLLGIGTALVSKKAKYFLYSAFGIFSISALLHGTINFFTEAHMYLPGVIICVLLYLAFITIFFQHNKQKRIQLRL